MSLGFAQVLALWESQVKGSKHALSLDMNLTFPEMLSAMSHAQDPMLQITAGAAIKSKGKINTSSPVQPSLSQQ